MKSVVYPGSFDPITLGHLDIIKRAATIFDEVYVCVLNNSAKKTPLFSLDERVKMIGDVVSEFDNVKVASYGGLLVDFAKQHDINVIIRGLREITDAGTELSMAQGNHTVAPDIDTLFLATDPKYSFISSSMVREFAGYGRSVEGFVPDIVNKAINDKYKIN
ncbi:MAG: pantetheine-phosphate adenylyltransferase [Eubacterium sp.]|nr:pantetheine-phosphate adenylyltransferase [Eubacterium sp.]